GAVLLLALLIPAGIWLYRNGQDRDAETRLRTAVANAFPGPSRTVALQVERGDILLRGTIENAYRRAQITDFIRTYTQGGSLTDALELPPAPPFPELTAAQAGGITAALNRIPGVCIESAYADGALTLNGQIPDTRTALRIVEAYASLPGLREITNRLQPGTTAVADRIHFPRASAELSADALRTVSSVYALLARAPWIHIQITGHSDSAGDENSKERIALLRAQAVASALVNRGIDPGRLVSIGAGATPAGTEIQYADSLNRCVVFTLLPPAPGATP
ncbi:partial putative lipoprotein YiaD, partial [Anaerolineae bacterium]